MIVNHILSKNGFYWLFYYLILLLKVDRLLSDRSFLELQFRCIVGKQLDLKDPKTFNEKLQWLKLYDRRPEYTTMVDKYAVKGYVSNIIGAEYIIPTIGVWNSPEDIEWELLPKQFVLKCTHDSGGLVICKNKAMLDKRSAINKLNKCYRRDYYMKGREWAYKDVPRRIIAEKYIEENSELKGLQDFKFMCFNGKVKCCFTCTNRYEEGGLKVTFYDDNWNVLDFERSYPREKIPMPKPHCYDMMKRMAEKIADNLLFARIDFYEIDNHPYFGEITLYPGNGLETFQPEEWDYILGSWMKLPSNQ